MVSIRTYVLSIDYSVPVRTGTSIHRPEFRISFNGYTLPGENDTVFLEWVADKIESPMRDGNNIPPEAMTVGAQVRELIESQRIEFMEYLSDDKILKD